MLPRRESQWSGGGHLTHSGIVLRGHNFKLPRVALLFAYRARSVIGTHFNVVRSRPKLGDAKVSVFVSLAASELLPNTASIHDLTETQSHRNSAHRFALGILDVSADHGFWHKLDRDAGRMVRKRGCEWRPRLADLIGRKKSRLMRLDGHGWGAQMIELEIPILVCELGILISLDEGVRNRRASGGIYDRTAKVVCGRRLLIVAKTLRFGMRQKTCERRYQYSTTTQETIPGDTKLHAHKAS